MFEGSSNQLGMGVSFYLKNEFSNSAKTIEEDLASLQGVTEESVAKIAKSIEKMKVGFVSLAVGGAMLLPFMAGIKLSNDLEDSFADVRKTTGMLESDILSLKDSLFAEDTRTGIFELIDIAKIGGQIGVAKNDILGFTQSVDKMVVALGDEFTGGAEEVTKTVGVLRNILTDFKTDNVSDDLLKIGNVLNELGAAGFATAPVVSDFASRIGAAAIPMGIASSKIFGLSATLQELGVNAERGGTAMQRFFMRMASNSDDFAQMAGMTKEAFKDLVNQDSFGAFEKVLESTRGMDNIALSEYLNELNLDGAGLTEVFMKLRNSTDMLHEKMTLSATAMQGTDSIMSEFNIKNETVNASIEKMQKKFQDLATTLSGVIVPIIKPLISLISGLVDVFTYLLSTKIGQFLAGIVATMGVLITLFGAYNLAVGVAGFLSGKFALSLAAVGMTELATTFATGGLTAGFYALAVSVWTALAPLLPFIAIGAAIVGVVWMLVEAWDSFTNVLNGTEEPASGFLGWLQRVGGVMQGVFEIFQSWNGETFSLSENMKKTLESMGLLDLVLNIGTWVVRIIEFFKAFAEPIIQVFGEIWGVIKEIGSLIMDSINSAFEMLGFNLEETTSQMSTWISIGKFLGSVVATPFKILGFALKGIVWLLNQIIDAYQFFMKMVDSTTDFISGAFTYVKEIVTGEDNGEIAESNRITANENRGMETIVANNARPYVTPTIGDTQRGREKGNTKVNNNIVVQLDGRPIAAAVRESQEEDSNRQ